MTEKTSTRIRELAHELGVIVELPDPELPRAQARTHVRRQLLPGQLKKLMAATGKPANTVLRALGTDPKRAGRKPSAETGQPKKRIDTETAVQWLMSISRDRKLSSEASHALEMAAIGMKNGDAHANKNPYDGKPFK